MSVLATDDFNRADGAESSGNWTGLARAGDAPAGLFIESNQVRAGVGATQFYQWAYWDPVTWPNDHYSKITRKDTVPYTGPAARLGPSGDVNGYTSLGNGGAPDTLYRMDAGGFNAIGTSAGNVATDSEVTIEVVGDGITVKDDGVEIISVTDATYATGSAGVFAYCDTAVGPRSFFDNFIGGDFSANLTPTPSAGALALAGQATSLKLTIKMPDEP